MKNTFYYIVVGSVIATMISCTTYSTHNVASRNPTQEQTSTSDNSVKMDVANECAGLKAKPFSSYSKFYFKPDGTAYGLKNEKEIKLNFEESYKVYNADGSLNYIESLNSFKAAKGITSAVCNSGLPQSSTGKAVGIPAERPTSNASPGSASKAGCNIKSDADSVVLAMSWQPAFCEGKPGKPECRLAQFLTDDAYQAKNFTLHGLWPNRNSCGQNYGFCNEVKSPKNDFCLYPEVTIADHSIEKELETVMPSKAAGSCLERHEWHKHGTCQDLDTTKYFARAIKLLKNFNESSTAALIRDHIKTPQLKKSELLKSLDIAFGDGASKNFIIVCKKSVLTEIQITLTPKILSPDLEDSDIAIKNLIDKSAKGYIRNCNEDITIDQTGPG